MVKGLKSYRKWLDTKLADPERAARFLTTASRDSEASLRKAIKKVIEARSTMTEIAQICGISRESLHRMLTDTGNPTSENKRAILTALGFAIDIVPATKAKGKSFDLPTPVKAKTGTR